MQTLLITGAAGFIGSALCRYLREGNRAHVIGVDRLTYAASPEALASLKNDPHFKLIEADICDAARMMDIVNRAKPAGIFNLAAETHVDRSIDRPDPFLQTNIVGAYAMLEVTRMYLAALPEDKRASFRFLQVSTDEVHGSIEDGVTCNEAAAYAPNSPYAASKAAADHLARAWHKTYGVPAIISNCSNNYGPWQFPEKLIPLMIMKALKGEKLPVYGQGLNLRDWLYVEDHAEALYLIFAKGRAGEKYHVGGDTERRNLDLIGQLCDVLDEKLPQSPHRPHRNLINFVADRPGHDRRYAIDCSKIKSELGWKARTPLDQGLRQTVEWYIANRVWCDSARQRYGGERLGQIAKSA